MMKPQAESGTAPASTDLAYERRLTIRAARERVFGAIATLDGPRHWWTTMSRAAALSPPSSRPTLDAPGLA
jgi:uncharacterized protein YndB with AHSA1/START domain